MTSITVYTDVEVEVDIDLSERREEILEALGLEDSEPCDLTSKVLREFQLFGPAAAIRAVEDVIYERTGIKADLFGVQK